MKVIQESLDGVSGVESYQRALAGSQLVSACNALRLRLKQQPFATNYKIIVTGNIGNLVSKSETIFKISKISCRGYWGSKYQNRSWLAGEQWDGLQFERLDLQQTLLRHAHCILHLLWVKFLMIIEIHVFCALKWATSGKQWKFLHLIFYNNANQVIW